MDGWVVDGFAGLGAFADPGGSYGPSHTEGGKGVRKKRI